MKQKPIKQIMNSRYELSALALEVSLHKSNILTGKFRLSDATRIVKEKIKDNECDPYFFARTVSGLMNGSLTPRDL